MSLLSLERRRWRWADDRAAFALSGQSRGAMNLSDTFIRHFAPEEWTAEYLFLRFLGPPFHIDPPITRGINAVVSHLEKYNLLSELANDIIPIVRRDYEQLNIEGFTPGTGGRKFGALFEAMLAELYSALDGLRQVVFSVYRKIRGVQDGSTYKLFRLSAQKRYGAEFPEELRLRLAEAYGTWFPKLSRLRSENTHGQIGFCYSDIESDKIIYMHNGLTENGIALIIEDVAAYLNRTCSEVRELMTWIFSYMYSKLEPLEREITCGVYKGRIYQRVVAPSATLTLADGRCLSTHWFSKEPDLLCPMRLECEAYRLAVSEEEAKAFNS